MKNLCIHNISYVLLKERKEAPIRFLHQTITFVIQFYLFNIGFHTYILVNLYLLIKSEILPYNKFGYVSRQLYNTEL